MEYFHLGKMEWTRHCLIRHSCVAYRNKYRWLVFPLSTFGSKIGWFVPTWYLCLIHGTTGHDISEHPTKEEAQAQAELLDEQYWEESSG